MPMTLEGGGTISQLKVMQQRGSHAPSKATPSSMSAKLRANHLSTYSIFTEDEWWKFVLREQSGPHESLNCPADCPVEGIYSLHLSWKRKPWKSLVPSLLMTTGSKIVEDFATALTQTAVFISFVFSLLHTVILQANCVSDSSTSMQTKRYPTGRQSPVDSRQYKTTTTKHQSIHQLLIRIKT